MARRSRFEVRLSDSEAARLDEGRGPMSRAEFFRKLLDAWGSSDQADPGPGPGGDDEDVPRHRHRPGIALESRWERGVEHKQWMCAEPGCGKLLPSR